MKFSCSNVAQYAFLFHTILAVSVSTAPRLRYRGVDWSSLLVEERQRLVYRFANGTAAPLEQILAASGVNVVRQRVWVVDGTQDYGLDYNLRLARRAAAAGMLVYLDFHYSDTWADPSHQRIPKGWPTDSVDALAAKVYEYTKGVCDAFAKERSNHVKVELVSIGNEITAGLLWPLGSLSNNRGGSSGGFTSVSRLLRAASAAVRDSALTAGATGPDDVRPKIMIHLDNGWDLERQRWWYNGVLPASSGSNPSPSSWAPGQPLRDADFDVLSVSYYPFYSASATLAALDASLRGLARAWPDKKLVVAETDWPASCPAPRFAFPADLRPRIQISAAGQAQFVKDVADVVGGLGVGGAKGREGSGRRARGWPALESGDVGVAKRDEAPGLGVFYWEPAWVHNANLGSSCADNTMFESDGTARDSLRIFSSL